MKIGVFSDLHLEFGKYDPPKVDADIIILAGDIHVGDQGIEWAKDVFKEKEVIYVIGNHEYYHGDFSKITDQIRKKATGSNIHVLEKEKLVIGEVCFLGCTLWTDFDLFGNRELDGMNAQYRMPDFNIINLSQEKRPLEPTDTVHWHNQSKQWLAEKTSPKSGKKKKMVVITHHTPSHQSIPKQYKTDALSAAFASNMDRFIMEHSIDLWVHGHVHESCDYALGNTRIICNPKGYGLREENNGFNPDLVVEI